MILEATSNTINASTMVLKHFMILTQILDGPGIKYQEYAF